MYHSYTVIRMYTNMYVNVYTDTRINTYQHTDKHFETYTFYTRTNTIASFWLTTYRKLPSRRNARAPLRNPPICS